MATRLNFASYNETTEGTNNAKVQPAVCVFSCDLSKLSAP